MDKPLKDPHTDTATCITWMAKTERPWRSPRTSRLPPRCSLTGRLLGKVGRKKKRSEVHYLPSALMQVKGLVVALVVVDSSGNWLHSCARDSFW